MTIHIPSLIIGFFAGAFFLMLLRVVLYRLNRMIETRQEITNYEKELNENGSEQR